MAGAFGCGVLHRAVLRCDVLRQIRKHPRARFYWCLRVSSAIIAIPSMASQPS